MLPHPPLLGSRHPQEAALQAARARGAGLGCRAALKRQRTQGAPGRLACPSSGSPWPLAASQRLPFATCPLVLWLHFGRPCSQMSEQTCAVAHTLCLLSTKHAFQLSTNVQFRLRGANTPDRTHEPECRHASRTLRRFMDTTDIIMFTCGIHRLYFSAFFSQIT